MNNNIFDEVFSCSKWIGQDDFPSCQEWKDEVIKWLQFLERNNQLERYKPRLRDNCKNRDKAIAEISAAFIIEEIFGYEIIDWEPKGKNNFLGDFSIVNLDKQIVFCEVKSPGWEGEIVQDEGINSPRLKKKKYVNEADGRSISPWERIRFVTNKSYEKFPEDQPNLLIINDDLFAPILDLPNNIDIALLEPSDRVYNNEAGYFTNEAHKNLGGILFLNIKLTDNVQYQHRFAPNPYSIHKCNLQFKI